MKKSNIPLSRDADKYNISFFENIIYWLWVQGTKLDGMGPWTGACVLACVLAFLNLAFIPYIILNIMDYDGNYVIFIYPVLLIIFMIKYDNKKYCIKKGKYGIAWDEKKYCILSDIYDNMFYWQRRKYKRIFLIYVITTILITVATLLIV